MSTVLFGTHFDAFKTHCYGFCNHVTNALTAVTGMCAFSMPDSDDMATSLIGAEDHVGISASELVASGDLMVDSGRLFQVR